jgi:hypothetical protein
MESRRCAPTCESCNDAVAAVFFVADKFYSCTSCEEEILNSLSDPSGIESRRESAVEIFELQNLTTNPAGLEGYDVSESYLIRANFDEDDNEISLSGGKALQGLVDRVSDPLNIVSFIGRAGSGKSFLARTLCCPNGPRPKPSSAASTGTASTADISAYQGTMNGEGVIRKFCVIDTEATHLNDNELPAEISSLVDQFGKRRRTMSVLIPHLVFEFSSVIVYVHVGELKQVGQNVICDLVQNLAANEVEHRGCNANKHLVIILNKCSRTLLDEYYSSRDSISLDQETQSQFDLLFRTTTVLPLPHAQDDLIEYLDNLRVFKSTIGSILLQSESLSAESTKRLLNQVVTTAKSPPKFTKQSIIRSLVPLSESLHSHLADWFNFLLSTYSLDLGIHLAFEHCISIIQRNVFLLLLRHVARSGELWEFFGHDLPSVVIYFEPLLDSLEAEMQKNQPCSATFTTESGQQLVCTVVRPGHTVHGCRQHGEERGEPSIVWPGVFVPSLHHADVSISRDLLVEQILVLPRFGSAVALDEWLSDAMHRMWVDMGIPRWSNVVCLGCCVQSPVVYLETCLHSLCQACLDRKTTVSRCNLCIAPVEDLRQLNVIQNRSESRFSWIPNVFGSVSSRDSEINLLDPAVRCGDLSVCKWIRRVYPAATASSEASLFAISRGYTDVVEWLKESSHT